MKSFVLIKKSAILIAFFLTILSCKKDTNPPPVTNSTQVFSIKDFLSRVAAPPELFGDIYFASKKSSSYQGYVYTNPDYEFDAGFAVGETPIDAGTLKVGNIDFLIDIHNNKPSYIDSYRLFIPYSIGSQNFGTNVQLNLSGAADSVNNIGAISANFYVPQEIKLLSPVIAVDSNNYPIPSTKMCYKTTPFNVGWNPDHNYTGSVFVVLEYIPSNNHPSMGVNGIRILKEVADNGSCAFTPTELAQFPTGSIVTLYLGRGVLLYPEDNMGRKIEVMAITTAINEFKMCQ